MFMVGTTDAKAAETDPKLNLDSCEVAIDSSYRLRVYNLDGRIAIYHSSDPSIATVNNAGRVRGVNTGDAVITVLVVDEGSVVSSLQCDVHVGPAAVNILFTAKEIVLKEGMEKKIYPIVYPKNTVEDPMYRSDDTSIATISSGGWIRAQSEGIVNVYGYLENGAEAVLQVDVLNGTNYDDYKTGKKTKEEIVAQMRGITVEEEEASQTEEIATTAPIAAPILAPAAPVAETPAGK